MTEDNGAVALFDNDELCQGVSSLSPGDDADSLRTHPFIRMRRECAN